MPENLALAALDVAGAPAQTAKLVKEGNTVLVLGAGGKSGVLVCYEAKKHAGANGNVVGVVLFEEDAKKLRELGVVDEVIAYIKSTGLNCYVGPFETTIEGEDYDQLMDIVKECQHIAIRAGAPKVSAYIKVVYEPEGEVLTIDKKVTKHHQA
jgi:uncharacterized protein YqgV (UPF0045/DUF77 family)